MNNSEHHNNFWSGFLMGAIVGALVVFFLATKKGKRLLRIITEEGSEGISELEELFSQDKGNPSQKESKSRKPPNGHTNTESPLEKIIVKGSEIGDAAVLQGRRLFKGIPKKR
ncbi:MAG: hypothetical protein A3B53_01740 [Candidatus Levybacteria bacterium RIFCSPLOWO2_01_FULL_42_15]|nr:MAG: hypothetical protein A3B53_01740 [Candidatus Levybacteria bacterium RIFCSPLOWO2_01_FULL_42_15]